MKAKHIKKLRNKARLMKIYSVRNTCGLFGDFFGDNRICLVMPDYEVRDTSEIGALRKYLKQYATKYNRKHDDDKDMFEETTSKWGRFMVTDKETGFMSFYK